MKPTDDVKSKRKEIKTDSTEFTNQQKAKQPAPSSPTR